MQASWCGPPLLLHWSSPRLIPSISLGWRLLLLSGGVLTWPTLSLFFLLLLTSIYFFSFLWFMWVSNVLLISFYLYLASCVLSLLADPWKEGEWNSNAHAMASVSQDALIAGKLEAQKKYVSFSSRLCLSSLLAFLTFPSPSTSLSWCLFLAPFSVFGTSYHASHCSVTFFSFSFPDLAPV